MDQLNTPPVFTQIQVEPTPPKKSYKWLIITALIFLLASTGVFAYKYYQLKTQTAVVIPSSTPNQVISPELTFEQDATLDPTVDWKTYTNTQYKYSIKYPSDWVDVTSQETIKYGNRQFEIETINKEYILGVVFETPADPQNDTSTRKSFNLKNGESLLITYVECQGPGCKFGTRDINIFDQILSTFKFTN